jgi:hypothetical protein
MDAILQLLIPRKISYLDLRRVWPEAGQIPPWTAEHGSFPAWDLCRLCKLHLPWNRLKINCIRLIVAQIVGQILGYPKFSLGKLDIKVPMTYGDF